MRCREDYRAACMAHKDGWQTFREFDDGRWQITTGNGVRLDLGGYLLPDKRIDAARVENKDVRRFGTDELADEWDAVGAADEVYRELKREGLRCITICLPLGGATEWEEWGKERREAISRLIMYGR